MEHWAGFYSLTGAAAATLMGLMFIAVTFGAKLVTLETVGIARTILSPIMFHFAHAFVIACVALVPNGGWHWMGAVAIGPALLRLLMIPHLSKQLLQAHRQSENIELSDWILSIALPVVLYLFLMTCGVAFVLGQSWPYAGIAMAVMSLLILGVVSAWDMMIWMASQV